MKQQILIDTGPLVAFLNERDHYHQWVRQQTAQLAYPFLTCEAVLSECCFILQRSSPGHIPALLDLFRQGFVRIPFSFTDHIEPILKLMSKYPDVPMSFADACLVRMTEIYPDSVIFTLDSDFQIYRKHGRQRIDCLIPET